MRVFQMLTLCGPTQLQWKGRGKPEEKVVIQTISISHYPEGR